MIRVVLTGSESTGKTVLAQQLATLYGAELVPEFAREFAVRKNSPLVLSDAEAIARGQMALEDEHTASAAALLIQDTDLLSTAVYSMHYYGECPSWIADQALVRKPNLYLLLEIDVPWLSDGVRDREGRREELQQLFRDAVAHSGVPYVVIEGTWTQRMVSAQAAIDDALKL